MKTLDFNTVQKLTGEGRYSVCTPLNYLKEKIEEWIKYDLNLDPDFQRGHVWTKEQQIAFVEFVLKGGKTTPLQFNHPNWMNSFKGEMVIVDGKQRLHALMLFLSNMLPVFGGYTLSQIEGIHLRSFDIDIRVNNLKTRKEVLTWYLEMNSGGTPHSEDELQRVGALLQSEIKK